MTLWRQTLDAIERDDRSWLVRHLDWPRKLSEIESHAGSIQGVIASGVDEAYGAFPTENSSATRVSTRVERISSDDQVLHYVSAAPETTRAHLRSRFIQKAREHHRSFTVDWTHLKLNDRARRTIITRDPFMYEDERVDRILAEVETGSD